VAAAGRLRDLLTDLSIAGSFPLPADSLPSNNANRLISVSSNWKLDMTSFFFEERLFPVGLNIQSNYLAISAIQQESNISPAEAGHVDRLRT